MTLHELLQKIIDYQGPCMRFCAYCPDDFNTAELKECIEEAIRKEYIYKETWDDMMKEIIKIRAAYLRDTGHEYKEDTDEDTNTES